MPKQHDDRHKQSLKRRNGRDPNLTEFGIVWHVAEHPFWLRAEDVFLRLQPVPCHLRQRVLDGRHHESTGAGL